MARYQRDAASPEVAARIARDLDEARAAGVRGLPTIYVGDRAFIGAGATVEELVAAMQG